MNENEGLLRRSLRRMNPFKTRIFHLPATPRLTRNRKMGSGCEDTTGWNFERTQSGRDRNHFNSSRIEPPISPHFKVLLNSDSLSRASSSAEYQFVSETWDPRSLSSRGKDSSPPPDPEQAESSIARHMHDLLLSTQERTSGRTSKKRDLKPGPNAFLQLPITKYTRDGQISEAFWDEEYSLSPNVSTISLLNTNTNLRSRGSLGRSSSFRSTHPIKGLSSTITSKERERSYESNLLKPPLFTLNEFYSEAQLDEPFLGREWVFRELYEQAVMERVSIVYIEGKRGTGKSAIVNQMIMDSSLFKRQTSDTLDSGCEIDSPHYEWLKAVAARIVAYHICSMQNASSCSIPEFVCNLGLTLAQSPVLRSYADIIIKNESLRGMLDLGECLRVGPSIVFQKAIVEPLSLLASSDEGCLLIVIDGLDEAEFHRSEAGQSIARFLEEVYDKLPSWIRLILTTDLETHTKLRKFPSKSIRLDVDERSMRDTRMLAEYRISMCGNIEEGLHSLRSLSNGSDRMNEFLDRIVTQSSGNLLYVSLLLSLAESDLIHLKVLTSASLPIDLDELYLLYFSLTFNSSTLFLRCAPILSILMASLKSLRMDEIASILNHSSPGSSIQEEEIHSRVNVLLPFVSLSIKGYLSIRHASFREWLHRSRGQCRYTVDPREGHLLLAVWLTKQGELSSSHLFDLAHHLLKSNPHKYYSNRQIPELSISRDCQIAWIEGAAKNIQTSLLNYRNILYPNIKVTRLLLLAGALANPERSERFEDSLLTLAARAGDISLVSLLIQYGAEINPTHGKLPVVAAAGKGHLNVLELLHQHGALQGKAATLAIMEAVCSDHLDIVSFLFQCDWHDSQAKEATRQLAFEKAAGYGSVKVCEYFLDEAGSEKLNLSQAMRAACLGGRAEIVQSFLSRGVTLSGSLSDGQSTLSCAVESGSWDLVVAVLSETNCSIDHKDKYGQTALHQAAIKGHVGLMDLLLKKGLSINEVDNAGWTPLMHAISHNHPSCVQLLLDKGADLHIRNKDGQEAIHVACRMANQQVIECFLIGRAVLEDKDSNGDHPIEIATKAKNLAAVGTLLRRGARLRSATWTTAADTHPPFLLILLRKLLDDASLLYKRRKIDVALERLTYAQEKCESLLENESLDEYSSELKRIKWQILFSTSKMKRRQGQLMEAIQLCDQAFLIADTDETLFQTILARAKCNFDNHDLEGAENDAKAALDLRPSDEETKQLITSLTLPSRNICKL